MGDKITSKKLAQEAGVNTIPGHADVIEDALKCYGGRAMFNSINFEDGGERAERVVPLARRFGASLVGLTIDEKGMAMNADEKFAVAKRLV